MNEEKLEPAQSLKLIEDMIVQARGKFNDNGHLYLLWGWVILFCSLFHFIGIKWQLFPNPEMVWMLTWAAFIYQSFYLYKHRGKQSFKSYTDAVLNAIWLVFIGCGVLLGFVVTRKAGWDTVYPLILMLYGVPTILSGVVLRFRPLVIGGLICWVLCILASFLPLIYNLLLVSAAVLAAWIVPGYLMRRRYQLENHL
jgi:hypothetical protein